MRCPYCNSHNIIKRNNIDSMFTYINGVPVIDEGIQYKEVYYCETCHSQFNSKDRKEYTVEKDDILTSDNGNKIFIINRQYQPLDKQYRARRQYTNK